MQHIRNKYTAAIIGVGRIGFSLEKDSLREQPASHSSALSANPRVSLVAAGDIDEKKLAAWKKDYPGAKAYLSTAELMQAEAPDIVVIAVNDKAHREVALTVLPFKPKLVILEKPVAINLEDAEEIKRAAGRLNVPVNVNHERRFARDYQLARELLAKKEIGELHSVRAHLWSGASVWSKSSRRDGECSLLHDGTHLVDTLHFLLGKELKNPSIDFIHKDTDGKIRSLVAHYVLDKSLFVTTEFFGNKKVFDFEIELQGSNGRIFIGNGFLRMLKAAPSQFYSGFQSLRRDALLKRPKETGYFSRMVENCVAFLDGRADLISPLSEGIKTLAALYRIIDRLP